jgi:hypothetical protein
MIIRMLERRGVMAKMKPHGKLLLIGLGWMLILLSLSACAPANQDVAISLKEINVNEVIQNAAAEQDLPFRVESVDMKDGFMRVFMAYRKEDGTELTGSYDIALNAVDGKINGEIIKVDMPGLKLDNQILEQIADLITQDFALAASRVNGDVYFVSLKTSEDDMQMVIQAPR